MTPRDRLRARRAAQRRQWINLMLLGMLIGAFVVMFLSWLQPI